MITNEQYEYAKKLEVEIARLRKLAMTVSVLAHIKKLDKELSNIVLKY